MGLLDDAIRDHLELKRRRGADPSEIAREEREALEPVFPDEPRPAGFADEPQAAAVLDEEPPHGDPVSEAAQAASAAHDDPFAGQPLGDETAELDMEAVLAEDAPQPVAAEPAAAEPAAADPVAAEPVAAESPPAEEPMVEAQAPAAIDDEMLEWETPGREEAEPPPEPLPGQESMSFE